jgi:DNA-binding NarL/FixJ family response regulator
VPGDHSRFGTLRSKHHFRVIAKRGVKGDDGSELNSPLHKKAGAEMSSVRVLVVEDFLPFRQLICATLGTRPDLQVICEASDGLEAVQKAEELQPDLILLDIGLPTLNGLDAAQQIRRLAPDSRIIFVSQESSADVVESALGLGALGYVAKTRVASDLLDAVDAVTSEKQFVRSG